ncbi:MAG: glycosyltransferase family 2 protein [Micromonosporaceae bacterium]|nr:glycosyltransferase family 2 protein [Micromonosporaceae bacterium]
MKLTIVMPVYNEAARVATAIKQVLEVDFPCEYELVIVDDGSTDATPAILDAIDDPRIRVFHQPNQGKGAAVRTGAAQARGDSMVILDADLEYDPRDIPRLLEPVLDGRAQVVFGSRQFGSHTAYSFWYVMGNKFLTTFANVVFNCYISDLETCYKLMPTDLYRSLRVKSNGFGMEAEVTGKLLRRGIRPFEVPISYQARSRAEGKKITWVDGVEALWIIVRERLRPRPTT